MIGSRVLVQLVGGEAIVVGLFGGGPPAPIDTGWVALTAGNGWSGSNTAYRRIGNVVYLRGELHSGANNTSPFTLPVGARPSSRGKAIVPQAGTAAVTTAISLAIDTNGVVTAFSHTGTIATGTPGYPLSAIPPFPAA